MASAARTQRADYAANCFTQDFRMHTNPSDHPSLVSKKLESDWAPSNSIDDHIHANSGSTWRTPKSDRSPDIKQWPRVKTNLGHEANYTCQHLNCWEYELGAVYAGFLDDNVKIGGDQSIKGIDAIGSANIAVGQPWHNSPTCTKNNYDTIIPKIEVSLNNDLHLTPKKKDQEEFNISNGHFMDYDIANFSDSEPGKMMSSVLESHLMGAEKTRPWWRTAGKDELASLVAQKSLEHIENCDLPQPQTKHFRQRTLYLKGVDHDKTLLSSLDQKAETGSSIADGCTSGTPTSGCSFQDSNSHFSQSKDSGSSNMECQINSENSSMTELWEALRHSQTRAREAEKAAQQAYSEKEHILSLFLRQATQLFACKQWFHILQLENLCLQLRNQNQPLLNLFPAALPWVPCREMQLKKSHSRAGKRKVSNKRCGIGKCAVAFAVGLGLAGTGLLLGWTMGWMFPSP